MSFSMCAPCLAGLLFVSMPPSQAAGAPRLTLSPLCVTRAGATLFFLEQTDDCGAASRRCRASRWAYAALKSSTWQLEPLGSTALDDDASPESNAQAARQLFKAPAAHPCASFFRSSPTREPDLADSEVFFRYSIEQGALTLHWQGRSVAVGPSARIWRASWCGRGREKGCEGPNVEAISLAPGATKPEPSAVPSVELSVGEDALLGFAEEPSSGRSGGFLIAQVPLARLRQLKAELLYEDAKGLFAKASGDLLASAKVAGLLDAALQRAPTNKAARLDYARLFAKQGDATRAVHELEHLRGTRELRSLLDGDAAFTGVRGKEPFRGFVERLP